VNAAPITSTFAPTRWTLVLRASGRGEEAEAALADLCGAYYAPVVAFLRHEGRDEDAAREMAHAFFAGLLADGVGAPEPARGRFRSYLQGSAAMGSVPLRNRCGHRGRKSPRRTNRGGADGGFGCGTEERSVNRSARPYDRYERAGRKLPLQQLRGRYAAATARTILRHCLPLTPILPAAPEEIPSKGE